MGGILLKIKHRYIKGRGGGGEGLSCQAFSFISLVTPCLGGGQVFKGKKKKKNKKTLYNLGGEILFPPALFFLIYKTLFPQKTR